VHVPKCVESLFSSRVIHSGKCLKRSFEGSMVTSVKGNIRASKMASAHSQDGVNARDFEGDTSL